MSEPRTTRPGGAPRPGPRETIFDLGVSSDTSPDAAWPVCGPPGTPCVPCSPGPERSEPPLLPRVTEVEIVRHYAHLARMNFGLDTGPYPLGSCTMKHNPRVNEKLARLEGFAELHPYQPVESIQGALAVLEALQKALAELSGLQGVTLQPSAGAHGELTALMCIRAAHRDAGEPRSVVIIPDTAHGTNPATVAMCGYTVITVPSDECGHIDIEILKDRLDESVAALMLTNPNTLGLFEPRILEITDMVHSVGAYAYCDGANLNAIMGLTRPGDQGFDALHINVHKTFSTPHGGGGPGAGPVCVSPALARYLPGPIPTTLPDGSYGLRHPERSIGRVRSFLGNFGVLLRSYAYIVALGSRGLSDVSEQAVISANYLRHLLASTYDLPYDRPCMHEFVLSAARQKDRSNVRALDIAKRLLDYGIHPPTVYFPLIVEEAMMIEPTETETLAGIEAIAAALVAIDEEASSDPALVRKAPHSTPVRRLDEARAAREPTVRWTPQQR